MNKLFISLIACGSLLLTACADRNGKFQSVEEFEQQQQEAFIANPSKVQGDMIDINITRATTYNIDDFGKNSVQPGVEILLKLKDAENDEAIQVLAPTKIYKQGVKENAGQELGPVSKKISIKKRSLNKAIERLTDTQEASSRDKEFVLVIKYLEIDMIKKNDVIASKEISLSEISANSSVEVTLQQEKPVACAEDNSDETKNQEAIETDCPENFASLMLNIEERRFTRFEQLVDRLELKIESLRAEIQRLRGQKFALAGDNRQCSRRSNSRGETPAACTQDAKAERGAMLASITNKLVIKSDELDAAEEGLETLRNSGNSSEIAQAEKIVDLAELHGKLADAESRVNDAEAAVKAANSKLLKVCLGNSRPGNENLDTCISEEKEKALKNLSLAKEELEAAKVEHAQLIAKEAELIDSAN